MKDLILYVHGRGGSAAESEHYRPLFPGCEVIGLDYQAVTPREAAEEIFDAVEKLKGRTERITLVANSIGAYFSMMAGIGGMIRKAFFISPIVDMELLIRDMMDRAGVTEAALKEKGVIPTSFGEELSWDYLCYVREHPLQWEVPTEILYGSRDPLTRYETVKAFARAHGANLTVMEGGEHWVHTPEQLRFLDAWIRGCEADACPKIILNTERLRLYPASRERMEAIIASEQDEALKQAYTEMLGGCLRHPGQWAWYALWIIEKTDGTPVGDLCFKGLGEDGVAEIGYGIMEEYQGRGYATEAVRAACQWAFQHPQVKLLEAETEAGNAASQRVLEKCGFRPNGSFGEEGPRFTLGRPGDSEETASRISTSFRGYRDEDYEAVCDFLIELNRKDRTNINWNWARFEWMMEHPEFDQSARSSIGLWWAESKVVGAAIYDMYFGEAFCGVLPEYEALYPEILDYACRELKDDSGLAVAINTESAAEIRVAEQAGFERIDQKETVMALSLDRSFSSSLPGGLQLREMDQIADRAALEWLFWQGFDHGDDREAFERSLDHVPHVRKHFNKALCLSAADPSGEPVSHCSLWFHPDTDYAYVEPVCTIPGFRGKGIASALLSEAFSRAKSLGARTAYVISDLPFYEQLGFQTVSHYLFFRKEAQA